MSPIPRYNSRIPIDAIGGDWIKRPRPPRIIRQFGSWAYLVDVGEGGWQGHRVRMGRVYEREQGRLLDPWPVDEITARGYWRDVEDLPETRQLVEGEIRDPDGGPMHYRNLVRRGFAKAKERTGVDEGRETPLVFHDLRRTFGSLLIAQGCDVVYVSRQMGHSSVAVTLAVYAKEFDGRRHSADAAARMEAAFGDGLRSG
jgi:integrase